MRIAGIDYSTKAVDLVTIPHEDAGAPEWHTFPLQGDDAFDRARDVALEMPGRASSFWDDILAIGIEHPGGKHGTGHMLRIQGAILSCLPAWVLVEPLPPAKWRTLVGLPGNASKLNVTLHSLVQGSPWPSSVKADLWPQDAHDAHLIAHATRTLITTPATV
jgi:hypothetical protein